MKIELILSLANICSNPSIELAKTMTASNEIQTWSATIAEHLSVDLTIGDEDFDSYDDGESKNNQKVTWEFHNALLRTTIVWNCVHADEQLDSFIRQLETDPDAEKPTSFDIEDCNGYLGVTLARCRLTFERSKYGNGTGDGLIRVSVPFDESLVPLFKAIQRVCR